MNSSLTHFKTLNNTKLNTARNITKNSIKNSSNSQRDATDSKSYASQSSNLTKGIKSKVTKEGIERASRILLDSK